MRHPTNNFDFLRLFAAICVLVSHQFALLGLPEPSTLPGQSLGSLGVVIFFTISGYLITQSWLADPNIFRFAAKRILRIWPALFVFTLLCAFVLGPIVTELPEKEYFNSPGFAAFFNALRLRIVYFLPGVFEKNPFPGAINGSLWTIPLEVKCYWILLAVGILRLLTRRYVVLAFTLGLAGYHFVVLGEKGATDADYLMRFGSFFCAGVCTHLFRDWRVNGKAFAAVALLVFVGIAFKNYEFAQWALLPFAIISIGEASTPVLRRFGRFGDLSYGAYVYAFTVQQTVIWATHGALPFEVYLALSLLITLAFAFASWHLVERPALRLKPRAIRPIKSPRSMECLQEVVPSGPPPAR